jgi:hypothetical protein
MPNERSYKTYALLELTKCMTNLLSPFKLN